MTVLLLNASHEPLRVITMRRAFGLIVAGKVDLLAAHGDDVVRTTGGATYEVPAVLRLRNMVRVPFQSTAALSRRAIEARDERRCQVVGCDRIGQTVDHVIPRSRGWRARVDQRGADVHPPQLAEGRSPPPGAGMEAQARARRTPR